jgi:hypothetical protein
MIKNVYWPSRKVPVINLMLIKLEHYRQIYEQYSKVKFHENPSSSSRAVPCGRPDERADMTKLKVASFFFKIFRTHLNTVADIRLRPLN